MDHKNSLRLGVNIDHVATLRQARGESYPSVVDAATTALNAGADQITIHLREDRRHIQDTDVEAVKLVTTRFNRPLNFEMGAATSILDIALATKPEWVCLVPEKREEKTTEGGLDLIDEAHFKKMQEVIQVFRKQTKTKVSLFLESNPEIIRRAIDLAPDAVEIHTGAYAKKFLENEDINHFLSSFKQSKLNLESHSIGVHAGHGLTDQSIVPLLENKLFIEYNVGHWIISQSIFNGLSNVVTDYKKLMNKYQY